MSIDTLKSSFSLSFFSLSTQLTVRELEPPGSPSLPFPAVCACAGRKGLSQGHNMGRLRPVGPPLVPWVGG